MRFLPAISQRLPSDTFFAELYLSPGPEHIGVTGDNSYQVMYGYDWLLAWGRDDGLLHLWQERDGAWVEVVDDLPPVFDSPAPDGSRRWSLAFDQAARVVVAYEDDAGVVRVTRWDASSNSYVQNVTFSGCDPCVVIDASWSFSIPGSDVLLFYLSTDRTRVLCRVQRDLYATEHEIWDYGQPVILDRVVAAFYRYQLLVSDAEGDPLPDALVSDMYPLFLSERLDGGGAFAPDVTVEEMAYVFGALEALSTGGRFGAPAVVGERAFYALPPEPLTQGAGEFGQAVAAVVERVFTLNEEPTVTASGQFGGSIRVQAV